MTAAPRFAGLVDLENMTVFAGARRRVLQASTTIGAISAMTLGMPVRAAMVDAFFCSYLGALSATSWGIETVKPEPDAADHMLLERGREFAAAGYTDLIVASGDHAFAELADLAALHVVSLPGKLSLRLRRRAQSVTLLDPQVLTMKTRTLAA